LVAWGSSQQWFRHSAYQLIEGDGGQLYIAPKPGAILEWYKPFDKFPGMLEKFYDLSLPAYHLIEELFEQAPRSPAYQELLLKFGLENKKQAANSRISYQQLADNLLEFVSHYGPFGLFWQDVRRVIPETEGGGYTGTKLLIPGTSLFCRGQGRKIGFDKAVTYDEYAKYFFPGLEAPYPAVNEFTCGPTGRKETLGNFRARAKASGRTFFSKYAEPVSYLVWHPSFWEIPAHQEENKERQRSNKTSRDFEIELDAPRAKLVSQNGKWQFAWEFKTLLDALRIMHISTITGTAPQGYKVCALPGCNKIHTRKGLYCDNKCTSVAAKRAQREREKQVFAEFAVVHKEGRTWEELLQLWTKEFPEGQQYKTVKGFRRAVIAAAKEFGLDCSGLLDTE